MARILKLYNSFLRCIKEVKLANGQSIELPKCASTLQTKGSLYICGPTVYSDSHMGHAITYVRADLFRRVLRSIFGLRLTTVMNITDIDDKILAKVKEEIGDSTINPNQTPSDHPFNQISEKYYKSFINDMNFIHVEPPDLTVKVSKQIPLIMDYIRQLEKEGHAYLASNGDVYFDVSSIVNYDGRVDNRIDNRTRGETVKRDIRDFALWKAAKIGEPVWYYKSDLTGQMVPGRPGWHVQCSAICSAIFGNQLDFHFGGKDLIFPHHYNEQACCCAYHSLDTSQNFHVWSKNWLHSGHLVLRDEKMSKSLGNTVGIRSFINDTSVNAMRLMCIASHYRSDVILNSELLSNMNSLDHKIRAFMSYIKDELVRINEAELEIADNSHASDLEAATLKVREDILDGICDDFDLSKGMHSIIDLSRMIYNVGSSNLRPKDIVLVWHLLVDWCAMCGLDYGSTNRSHGEQTMIDLVRDFRQDTRDLVVSEMRKRKEHGRDQSDDDDAFLKSLLKNCDNIRTRMDELGFVIRDKKTELK